MLILYQKVGFPLTRSSFSFSFWKHFFIRFSSSKTYTVNEFNYFLSDFCPTVLKVKRIKDCDSIIYPLFSCGGLTRTDDLWVMSPTSYQLLHSAMFCECKGTAFIWTTKYFGIYFFIKELLLYYILEDQCWTRLIFFICFHIQLLIIYLFSCVDERKELLLHK